MVHSHRAIYRQLYRMFLNLAVFLRAKIEVKECGRHGSSSSGTKEKVGILKQKFFEVDRAFLYFVWDYYTGSVLFVGRVARPIVL